MSYQCWTTDGYGFKESDLGEIDSKRIAELISKAPKYAKVAESRLKENDIEDPTVEDYCDVVAQDYCCGLAEIMVAVINEAEGLDLICADDFDEENYVLFVPFYPWSSVSEKEKNMTTDELDGIYAKYCKMLTNEPVVADYWSAENGG